MDAKLVKWDLTIACLEAINEYTRSTRGANMLGSKANAIIVPGTNIVQLQISTARGPRFFEIAVKEKLS